MVYVKKQINSLLSEKREKLETIIIEKGNWNLKYPNSIPLYTKPLGIVRIGEIELCFTHEEIIKIINLHHNVDLMSIKTIMERLSGEVKRFEEPFIFKVLPTFTSMINETNNIIFNKEVKYEQTKSI